MFSSLASFLFGSNTNSDTNSETIASATTNKDGIQVNEDTAHDHLVDADNLIDVTSITDTAAGEQKVGQRDQAIKRGKNRRNNARQHNKRNDPKVTTSPSKSKQTPQQLSSPSSESCDEDIDENEWYIVNKDDKDLDDSPIRGEPEPVIGFGKAVAPTADVAVNTLTQQRRLQHINSHSLYSGPRPQKQRNYLQKTRNNNRNNSGLSISSLSPSRTVDNGRNASGHNDLASADSDVIRSGYVAEGHKSSDDEMLEAAATANGLEATNKMEESWFITPPPCFTSVGPINMETSPYENLLIEHPSMSVYHSIKTAQEAAESFIKLDMGVNDVQMEEQKVNEEPTTPKKNTQTVQSRQTGAGCRLDRQSLVQLRQELMARNVQKLQTKKERKDICRTAINRANKVRDVQYRNHTQRRSDRQHSKISSYANNNRKSNNRY